MKKEDFVSKVVESINQSLSPKDIWIEENPLTERCDIFVEINDDQQFVLKVKETNF